MEQKQKAIVVGVNLNNQHAFPYSMEELRNLAATCNLEVVGEVTQRLNRVSTSHYIGKGKAQEILAIFEDTGADTVIFNDELTSSQIRNLEAALECMVIDRSLLILDIFAQRAKTKEAKHKIGIDQLIQLISDQIFKEYIQCKMLIPYDQGQLISYFNENAHILSTGFEHEGNHSCNHALVYRRYCLAKIIRNLIEATLP